MKKENELTKAERKYILEELRCSLSSTVYGAADVKIKDISKWKNMAFDLPVSEFNLIVSIIKKIKRGLRK